MAMSGADLKAGDVMTAGPVCVNPWATIRELARVFEENKISGAPVVNQDGVLVGVVSKTDLIRRCSEGTGRVPPAYLFEVLIDRRGKRSSPEIIPEALVCVEDIMTRDPLVVLRHEPAIAAASLMFKNHVHRVVVVDENRIPVGIVTSMDLLGALSGP